MFSKRRPALRRAQSSTPSARVLAALAALGLAFMLALLLESVRPAPTFGHGTVDQQYVGPFTTSPPLTNSLAQSFTPAEAMLVAVDLFLSTDDAVIETPTEVTIEILAVADWSTVLGSATATVPADTRSTDGAAYELHVDFSGPVSLTPEVRYAIRLSGAAAIGWTANSSTPYTRGNAFVGGSPVEGYDFGFRTYFEPETPSDETPPVITYDLDPELPANGWYSSTVTLDWTVTDEESATVLQGCDDQTVETDQDVTSYSCSASSEGGSSGPVVVEFGRDTIAPTIEATVTAGTAANGWYRDDVTVGFVCLDDRSGIEADACPGDQTLSEEGASVASLTATVFDRAGNESASSNVVTVSIDRTAPTVTITPDREPDHDGGYDHEVTFTATAEDGDGSGVDSCDAPASYSGPLSDNASVELSCTDLAGNTGSASYFFAFIEPPDTTPPTISAEIISGVEGNAGWYVSDVVVRFTCLDEDSGVPDGTCPTDETLTDEGAAVSSTARTIFDAAGNESDPSNVITVSIDKTAPLVEATASPEPNPAGWNSTPVTVTYSAADGGSGVDACDAPVTLASDGAGQSAEGSCADTAGNSQSASAININIDQTPPAVTITPSRSPDTAEGWDHPVTFTAAGSDEGSGIAYCDPPETYNGPHSSAASVEMACVDNAGNVGTASLDFEYVDGTPPVISFLLSPDLPESGWYTSDVVLAWTVVEAESPETLVLTGCTDEHVTVDRGLTTYTCAALSAGGAASVVEVEFGRDSTRPVIEAVIEGTQGTGAWFTSEVEVSFSCSDAGSGVALDTLAGAMLTEEGADQSVTSTGSCVDRAGNAADPLTASGIDIDQSGPTATIEVVSGTLGLDGWYTSNVVARTAGADEVSGSVTCTADQTLSTDSAAHTFAGSCTNAAGLSSEAEDLTVKRDATAPALSPSLSSTTVDKGDPLTVAANAVDATSGVATSSCGTIDTNFAGTYAVTCSATDRAGNSASGSVSYQVLSGGGVIVYGFAPPGNGGYGTFSFGGGTFEELLVATGCPRATSVLFYNKQDGRFAVWIPGAQVGVVNEEFLALFPGTPPLPDGAIFTARCV
ncbi:MAG: hypothetical protein R3B59_04125 [Dehalococcoidia bacterium]